MGFQKPMTHRAECARTPAYAHGRRLHARTRLALNARTRTCANTVHPEDGWTEGREKPGRRCLRRDRWGARPSCGPAQGQTVSRRAPSSRRPQRWSPSCTRANVEPTRRHGFDILLFPAAWTARAVLPSP